MRAGFQMNGEDIGACIPENVDVLSVHNHGASKVSGDKLAHRLNDGQSERNIRDKYARHHIHGYIRQRLSFSIAKSAARCAKFADNTEGA